MNTNETPMQTRELSIVAEVRGLYATVETTLVFHNPNGRDLEGELVFPLPDGAAVCGYALDIGGRMVDGVVVKKEKARVAFETETRRRVDPGLVEHVRGNLYKTRIYPLPADGDRTIRLTYFTPLAVSPSGDVALALPMPRVPLAKRSVRIEVARDGETPPTLGGLGDTAFAPFEAFWRVEKTEENVTPADDLLVALPSPSAQTIAMEKAADGKDTYFAISSVEPASAPEATPPPAPAHYTILWDASGSRAEVDFEKEYALLAALPNNPSFTLFLFRNEVEEISAPADGTPNAEWLIAELKKVAYDGGTDFAKISCLEKSPEAADLRGETLLFTDGFDTLSEKAATPFASGPVAIVSQSVADREALRQACGGRLVDLQTMTSTEAAAAIVNPVRLVSGLEGEGVEAVEGIGQAAAGRVRLLGKLAKGISEASVRIKYSDGGLSEPFVLRAVDAHDGKVLATAWAAARINRLAPRADDNADDLLALGRRYGLVSPATSLIVLESLDQWVHHEIEPPKSWPEMREKYFDAMKARDDGDDPAEKALCHIENLERLWDARVAWWKDYKKGLPSKRPRPGGASEDVQMEARAMSLSVNDAAPLMAMEVAEDAVMAGASGQMSEPRLAGARDDMARRAKSGNGGAAAAAIQIKAWNPDVPYLKKIRKAKSPAARYKAYLKERAEWAQSPAFFLDCADAFLNADDPQLGIRILSNLAEMRIEDVPLLRVFAWRLQQAGALDMAIVQLRRIAALRPEEPQAHRDLALALIERGKARMDKGDINEAFELLQHVAFTPWHRHADSIPLFALEEMNALVVWCDAQKWRGDQAPAPAGHDNLFADKFKQNLDLDLRIVMSWDADATDIDLHVIEPSGEEAYYAHNRTEHGGLVSRDITDGYGPEEYLIRKATPGPYAVKTKYFASHQQTVIGPSTVTATVFTDWGRPSQKQEVMTLRLDKQKETVEIGTVDFE